MATELGKLMVTLGLDSGGFDKGLGSAQGQMDGFVGKAVGGGAKVGLAFAGIGVAGAAGLGIAINAAAGFEQQLDAVGAVSNATADEMAGLSDTALRIGKDTAFSASEAAGAMEILAANGLTAQQIMDGAADATVALAAAGGTDLAMAADVASTAMKVWGLSGTDLTDVVNRVAGAANVSRFGVEDMSLAIAQGAGIAEAMGVSYEDFFTAIASSADLFSSGADAGTSFKTMLLALANPIGDGKKAIAEYGLEFRNADGSLKSLGDIAGELQGKLGNLTDAQRDQALAAIFGNDASRAAIGLMRQGKEGFEAMSDTMGKSDAAEIAAKRMGNFKGSLESLKGSIETIEIEVGLRFLPVLTMLANLAATYLPVAFDKASLAVAALLAIVTPLASAFIDRLVPAIQSAADTIMPFIQPLIDNQAVMQGVAIILGTVLVAAFLALTVAAAAWVITAALALAPFLLFAVAVGALIAVVVLLVQHWDEIVQKFPAAGEALTGVKNTWADFVAWVTGTFIPLFTQLSEAIGAAMSAIVTFVTDHWATIDDIFDQGWQFIWTQTKLVLDLIKNVIEGTMKVITGIINVILGVLTGDWDRAWNGIKQILSGVWQIMSAQVEFVWGTIKNLLTNGLDTLKQIWDLAWEVIKNKVIGAWDNIKTVVSSGKDAVVGFIINLKDQAIDLIQTTWNAVTQHTTAALSGLVATVRDKVDEVIQWFQGLPGRIVSALGDFGHLLYDLGVSVIQGLLDGVYAMRDAIYNAGRSAGGWLKDGVSSGIGKLIPGSPSQFGLEVGEALAMGVAKGTRDNAYKAEHEASMFAGNLAAFFEGLRGFKLGLEVAPEWLGQWGEWARGADLYKGSLEEIASGYFLIGDEYNRIKELAKNAGIENLVSEVSLQQLASLIPIEKEMQSIMQQVAHQDIPEVNRALQLAAQHWQEMLMSGQFTTQQIREWSRNDYKAILDESNISAQEWATRFRENVSEAGAAFSDLNDFVRFSLGENADLLDTWKELGVSYYEDFTGFTTDWVHDMKDQYLANYTDFQAFVDYSAEEMASHVSNVHNFTEVSLAAMDQWVTTLTEQLAAGHELGDEEIRGMFDDIMDTINGAPLDQAARDTAKSAMDAIIREFEAGGGAANSRLIDIINQLLGTARQGAQDIGEALGPPATAPNTPNPNPGNRQVYTDASGRRYIVNAAGSVQYLDPPREAPGGTNGTTASGGGGIHVELSGPTTIYANDEASARSARNDDAWRIVNAMKERGVI